MAGGFETADPADLAVMRRMLEINLLGAATTFQPFLQAMLDSPIPDGLLRCAALAHAHGVELVPHQTQPTIGHLANIHVLSTIMHLSKPVELADNWERANGVFPDNPSEPKNGLFHVPTAPGLGIVYDEAAFRKGVRPLSL